MREEVVQFAQRMEEKLADNDHKPGWKHCSREELFTSLLLEVDELEDALFDGGNVIDEAVDVANFAMMIADITGHTNS